MWARLGTALALGLVLASGAAEAGDAAVGSIKITKAWSRAVPGQNGAAFMTITNTGTNADRLVSGTSPASASVELHAHEQQNGIMRMSKVPGIEVPPGGSVTLAPGGLHVMLMGMKAAPKQGQTLELGLVFEKAGAVTVPVDVMAAGAVMPQGHGHDHMMQHHGSMSEADHQKLHEEHMKDPAHREMHERMHGGGK